MLNKKNKSPVIPLIGITGDSGTGKSMMAEKFMNVLGKRRVTLVCGDDAHKWERGDKHWNKLTHLNPVANRLVYHYHQLIDLKHNKTIYRKRYDHDTGKFTEPIKITPKNFIITEGLHNFFLDYYNKIYTLKVFVDPDEKLRKFWKMRRDMAKRGYSKESITKQLKMREKDAVKYIKPQKENAEMIITFKPKGRLNLNRLDKEPKLVLYLDMDPHLDMDPLVSAFERDSKIKVTHFHTIKKRQRLVIDINGTLPKEDILDMLGALNLKKINNLPVDKKEFDNDYLGLLQLIFIYVLDHKLTIEKIEHLIF